MSSAPPTDDVPPPEYQAQEPSPAEGRTKSKNLMGFASPAMPYPKDEKIQRVESNIGERERTWGGIIGDESVVEGSKRYRTDYSLIYSEEYGSVSNFTGFHQGGTILKGKNIEVSGSFQGQVNPEKQYVIKSESFIGNPDMLRNIVGALMEKHSRFTFTYDPTSGYPTLGSGLELQERGGRDDIAYYPPWTKIGKLPERKREILIRKMNTIHKAARWQCCECKKRIREAEEDEEIPVMDSENPECRKCGHKYCDRCPDRGNEFWPVLRDG